MLNEKPLNSVGPVKITSNYEHILEQKNFSCLNFLTDFSGGNWTHDELNIIKNELEDTAKWFAEEQGLKDTIVEVTSRGNEYVVDTRNTGKLYNSIKARFAGDKSVELAANARNSRGQPYAGHIEYGFHDRGGNFIPARPFLRPALYAVSEASKGRVRSVFREILEDIWSERGYQGISNITSFGRMMSGRNLRAFYQGNGKYVSSYFNNQKMGGRRRQQIRQGELGKGKESFSLSRYTNKDTMKASKNSLFKNSLGNSKSFRPIVSNRGKFGDKSRNRPKNGRRKKEIKKDTLSKEEKIAVAKNEQKIKEQVRSRWRSGGRLTYEEANLYLTEWEHAKYYDTWKPTGQTYKKNKRTR